jgi:hypothetical protein
MVQLKILTGKKAGRSLVSRRFPFRVGRNHDASLCLEEKGVWDDHLEFDLGLPEGFVLKVLPAATAALNGQPVKTAVLRNGDLIEIGPVKIQFWLSEVRQRSLRLRELSTWSLMTGLCLGQIMLIYFLLP